MNAKFTFKRAELQAASFGPEGSTRYFGVDSHIASGELRLVWDEDVYCTAESGVGGELNEIAREFLNRNITPSLMHHLNSLIAAAVVRMRQGNRLFTKEERDRMPDRGETWCVMYGEMKGAYELL